MDDKLKSFVAADSIPLKLLQSKEAVRDGRIVPYHLHLHPTNRCQCHCSWCCCRNEDRAIELPRDELVEMARYFRALGSRAVTITGGGEPTLHPYFIELLEYLAQLGYDIGLATNGFAIAEATELSSLVQTINHTCTWVRISVIGTQAGDQARLEVLEEAIQVLTSVDVGISFTVTDDVSPQTALAVALLAEKYPHVTHVRYVNDITTMPSRGMNRVVAACGEHKEKAIFQTREAFTTGRSPCLVSLLAPVVDAYGNVYPCCGVPYAAGNGKEALKMDTPFSMGHWSRFHTLPPFDASACQTCYYDLYNTFLSYLTTPLEHERFL